MAGEHAEADVAVAAVAENREPQAAAVVDAAASAAGRVMEHQAAADAAVLAVAARVAEHQAADAAVLEAADAAVLAVVAKGAAVVAVLEVAARAAAHQAEVVAVLVVAAKGAREVADVAGKLISDPSRRSHRPRGRRGLSLLELVLALAIAVIVLGLISMALQFQLRTFENRRDRVEEAQLARAILRTIGDDLRGAVAYRPIDLGGIDAVSGLNPLNSVEGDLGSLLDDPAADGMDPTGLDPEAMPSTGSALSAGSYVAGLYGTSTTITFDMSRLPRLDEYQPFVISDANEPITQIPSDVRTVSYYLAGDVPLVGSMQQLGGLPPDMMQSLNNSLGILEPRGLVRQERDRAVATYSNLAFDAGASTRDTGEQLLADEVTRLEFRYFDGFEWWLDWDSDVRGGLPMAIEIVVGMTDIRRGGMAAQQAAGPMATGFDPNAPRELFYRLVVRIPTAEPLDSMENGGIFDAGMAPQPTTSGGF
jgi:hypothetical protein